MNINKIGYGNADYSKPYLKNTEAKKPNENAKSKEDTVEIKYNPVTEQTPQLNRAQAQHFWLDVGEKQVSTFVTADGIWMAKNGGIGREVYELIDTSDDSSGLSLSTRQELEYMSKMLANMPSGQLSVKPGAYGRSVMENMGIKLSDLTGTYCVSELLEMQNMGKDLSKLPSKPSLVTAEQISWLRGNDMMKNPESFQTANLKEILQELTNAFAAVGEGAQSAFLRILENNRGALGVQLMSMKFTSDSASTNPAILEQMRIDSERQIDLFGNDFLDNFKELGAQKAFETAWEKLG